MSWRERAAVAALFGWLIASVVMAVGAYFHFGPSGQDFRSFYAAGRLWLIEGRDPYDFVLLAPLLETLTGRAGNFAFYSPPWFATLVAPLALLPFQAARLVWLVLNVAAWTLTLWLLYRALDWPRDPLRRWLLFLYATYLLAWMTWRFEQVGILLALGLAGALWAHARGRERLAGAAIALLLIKPTIALVPVGALGLWALRGRRRRLIEGLVAGGLLLALLSIPLLATWLEHLRDPEFTRGLTLELDGPGRVVARRINTTLADWLGGLGLGEGARGALWIGAALAGGAVLLDALGRELAIERVAARATLVGFWLVPYALQYDYPLLVVPLFVAARRLGALAAPRRIVGALLIAAIGSVPVWEQAISDGFWIVIGLSLLALVAETGERRHAASIAPALARSQ